MCKQCAIVQAVRDCVSMQLRGNIARKHKKIQEDYQISVSSCIEYSQISGSNFPVYTDTEARLIGSVSTLKPLLKKCGF